jgi:predicted DNA-binding antitoxin AbrB/MazE fold protein
MTKTVEAIYENGVLRLPEPLPLPEKSHVTVTIESAEDAERGAWLKVSEAKLAQAWGDSDDVFNELLKK